MNIVKLSALLSGVVLLAGCATSGMEATGKTEGDPAYAKHLVIHNEPLANVITITDMRSRFKGGLLEVNIELSNLSSSDKSIQYRFSWYDGDNFEVEQGSRSWIPVVLHGKSSVNMQAVAPNSSVTTYKVNVREL
ncbi:MAG TPA: DUF1425 domain-containing protein [Gammaproteobacteria bacterium]|nr:DUF1425 domain-containing protein [Gammaproteobacteria bacterium]